MESLAYRLQMDYSRKDEFGLRKRLGAFQLFRRGGSRKIRHLLTKQDDWLESQVAIFDYKYTIQHGKSSTTYTQTVFFMDCKRLGLPQFLIKPENFFHRIGKYLDFVQDIEFEEHPEFSRRFLIQSEFPEMLKDLVTEPFVRFFTLENKWSLEGINYFLIFYRNHKRLKPEVIEDFYHKGLSVVDMLRQEGDNVD